MLLIYYLEGYAYLMGELSEIEKGTTVKPVLLSIIYYLEGYAYLMGGTGVRSKKNRKQKRKET